MGNGKPAHYLLTCLALVSAPFFAIQAQSEEPGVLRGAELLAPFKMELKQALVAGMQEGPLNAVRVCKERAPAIADSLAADGVEIGRSSHRLRNSGNSARDWVIPIIRAYLADAADRSPRLIRLSNDRWGYAEPIETQALCLACHGKAVDPDVAASINTAYPNDQATGFDVGDLRGVFWVEYPVGD